MGVGVDVGVDAGVDVAVDALANSDVLALLCNLDRAFNPA